WLENHPEALVAKRLVERPRRGGNGIGRVHENNLAARSSSGPIRGVHTSLSCATRSASEQVRRAPVLTGYSDWSRRVSRERLLASSRASGIPPPTFASRRLLNGRMSEAFRLWGG